MVDGDVLMKLENALASGALPTHVRKTGQHLLDRLQSPVRCVVLGLPGSGKSQLLNFLAGRAVIPDRACFPIFELSWAESPRTVFTGQDGTAETFDGIVLEKGPGPVVAFVKVEANLPMLRRFSLLEVGLSGSVKEQSAAVDWAIGRADIVLWCSQEFSPQEQNLWARVPDALKDHGFLVLTKADVLAAGGGLAERIAAVQEVAADEFHSVFPIATIQAIEGAQQDATVGAPALAASGGKALLASVLRQVDQGRSADLDSVLAFLSRHGTKAGAGAKTFEQFTSEDLTAKAAGEVPNEAQAMKEPSAAGVVLTALSYLKSRASDLIDVSADPDSAEPI